MTHVRHTQPMRNLGATLTLAVALLFACSEGETDVGFKDRAMDRIVAFQEELQAALRAALEEGGPVRAIDVCREKAPAIAAAASTEGLRVRRIGTRVRNHATNEPTDREREILAGFAALPDDQRLAAVHVEGEGAGRVLYAPIWLGNPLCLGCHGEVGEMDAKVREALAARYPEDEATGYTLGDLRGAFVVEMAN